MVTAGTLAVAVRKANAEQGILVGPAGAVLALEASRLARNDRDWSQLVKLGAIRDHTS